MSNRFLDSPTPSERLAAAPPLTQGGVQRQWIEQLTDLANLAGTADAVLFADDAMWAALQLARSKLDGLSRQARMMRSKLD